MKEEDEKIPTISVVTPSYNQGRFIEETIKSVISQEGDFFIEYLVMDGGSIDETVEILKRYEALIKERKWPVRCRGIEYRWVSEKDNGQADAVNKGFRAARGEIFGWLNSDDTYLPGTVGKVVEYFNEQDDVAMVYGEGWYIDTEGNIIERYLTEPFNHSRLAEHCFFCQPSVFLRREVIDTVGLLDSSLEYCMDYEYWIRVSERLKVGYISNYLANSRLYPETKTLSKGVEVHEEIIRTIKCHFGCVPSSWILGYVNARLGGIIVGRDTPLKKFLYWTLAAPVYIYKYIRVNFAIPCKDIRLMLAGRPPSSSEH